MEAFLNMYGIINNQSIEDGIYTLKTIAATDESAKTYTDTLIKSLKDRTHTRFTNCFIISEQFNRKKITKEVYNEYLKILYRSNILLEVIVGSIFPNAIKNVLDAAKDFKWKMPDSDRFEVVAHPLSFFYFLKAAYTKTEGDRHRAVILTMLCENITYFAPKVNNVIYVKLFELKKGRSLFMDIFEAANPHMLRLSKSRMYNAVLHYKHRDFVDKCM